MWLGQMHGYQRTWSQREIAEISALLSKFNEFLPHEIHRSIRLLDHIKHWKGTEFRTFLLYIGIVVLKQHLNQREYEMFLKLYCAVTICSANIYKTYLPLARTLFIDFIEEHLNIYGEGSITINIHNSSHVVDDVEKFGPLDTFSAYEFENCFHHIKLQLKQCRKPLEQIARRIVESSVSKKITIQSPVHIPQTKHQFTFFHPNNDSHILAFQYVQFKPNTVLSCANNSEKNKWFLTVGNNIVEFHFITNTEEKYIIYGSPLKNIRNFFEKPFDSKYINVFLSDREKCEPRYFELNDTKAKMFCMPYENNYVFIPLLHTF